MQLKMADGQLLVPPRLMNKSDEIIDLGIGAPGIEALKKNAERFVKAANHAMTRPNAYQSLQYGYDKTTLRFRTELANFLTKEYGDTVRPNDIVGTAGASHGLFILATLLFGEEDVVFVEEATYFLALNTFKDLKRKVIPIALDDDGIVPQDLERAIKEHLGGRPQIVTEDKPFVAMVYTIPCFQNPTGVCYSSDRCKQLVEIARRHNLLVVAEDVYNLLYFPEPDRDTGPPKRLFAYDDKGDPDYKGNVVSNATFSKIFSPGNRIGWLEAPQRVVNKVLNSGYGISGGSFNHTMLDIAASLISLGLLSENIQETRIFLKESCSAFCDTLEKELPCASFNRPKGGYFVWIALPRTMHADDVLALCNTQYKVKFRPGYRMSPKDKFVNYVRASFSYYEAESMRYGAQALARVVSELMSS